MSSPDSYPGDRPENRGAHPIDSFIHRHVTTIVAGRQHGEDVRDPDSRVARRVDGFTESLRYLAIDEQRIRIGTTVAHMNFAAEAQQLRRSKPEDFGAETA
jgi:hypothetical protein